MKNARTYRQDIVAEGAADKADTHNEADQVAWERREALRIRRSRRAHLGMVDPGAADEEANRCDLHGDSYCFEAECQK